MEWRSFENIIEFAKEKETGAFTLYDSAAKIAQNPAAKAMFQELAAQERGHRAKLENLQKEGIGNKMASEVPDLKIGNYLVEKEFHPDMSYQDILILAMKREEKSVSLYSALERQAVDPGSKELFRFLIEEEKKHKYRLEREYDDVILKEN